jgi:hypothetical protein
MLVPGTNGGGRIGRLLLVIDPAAEASLGRDGFFVRPSICCWTSMTRRLLSSALKSGKFLRLRRHMRLLG